MAELAERMQRTALVQALPLAQDPESSGDIAVMLTGGGARAAYQVGLIKGLARHFPHLQFRIVTGVSAGAINAMFLAGRKGTLTEKADQMSEMWGELQCSSIWEFDWWTLIPFRSALASIFPRRRWTRRHSLVNTAPLAQLLYRVFNARPGQPIPGIQENIDNETLRAVALITLDYATGETVRWFQGQGRDSWAGPHRKSVETALTVEHVLASSALPLFFPAVKIGPTWHGDGGIRLVAPLSPAVHLGATKIIAMSTGYQRSEEEAGHQDVIGYPPAAQILGQLLSAIFLDVIDEDVTRLERLNRMLKKLEPHEREGFKPIDLLVLRPSVDPSRLAAEYEEYLPRNLKLLTRALGAKETESPDIVSLLMFEPHYTRRLIEVGEADVEARLGDIREFLGDPMANVVGL